MAVVGSSSHDVIPLYLCAPLYAPFLQLQLSEQERGTGGDGS